MNQITLRGFSDELRNRIQDLARRNGLSLNRAALDLLRTGAGIDADDASRVVGASLDHLFGTWDDDEEQEFLDVIKSCDQIDEDFWR